MIPTKEQYELARSNLDYAIHSKECSRRHIEKLLDSLCEEREAEKRYDNLANECRKTILSYSVFSECRKEDSDE